MLLEVIMISMLCGVAFTLLVQMFLMRWYLNRAPVQTVPEREQFPDINLPKILKDKLSSKDGTLNNKEACLWLNLMGQFLFQELRDTNTMRRWVMRKMNFEFAELLQTTSGKLLAHIIVRDFSLGTKCPMLGNASVQKVEQGEREELESVDIHMDVDYDGGFTLGIDVMLPFNKQAFISVTLRRLSGRARLQLTRLPYTHWSFSFLQEPDVSFDVESHFEGRPLPQVAALIVNQLRRTIRKKHTLPNHKMRFKPVFSRPEVTVSPCRLQVNGQCITVGRLCVTFIKCSRLPSLSKDTTLYCILSADIKPWKELVRGQNRVWVTYDMEITKGPTDNIGINFKDEYLMDRYGMAVLVDVVQSDTPAARADIRKGDVLIALGTTRIVSTKQATKLFKNAGERFMVRIERPQAKLAQDIKYQEDPISFKDGETEILDDTMTEDGEEFINITLHPTNSSPSISASAGGDISKEQRNTSLSTSFGPLLRPKSATDLSSATQTSVRPKHNSADSTKSVPSPHLKRKSVGSTSQAYAQELTSTGSANSLSPGPRLGQRSSRKDHSPGRDSVRSDGLFPDRREEESKSMCSADSDSDEDSSPVMKTREVPASQNPRWHDPLWFDLGEQHAFLNVCVWCHNMEHTEVKPDRPTPPPHRDLLLGQVSVPINMIVLQCLMTMQGDTKQTLELQPGQIKAGASRKSLASHIGFEVHRCYGDITMRFQFNPCNLAAEQRQAFVRDLDPADPSDLANAGIEVEAHDSSQEDISDSESVASEGRHLFSRAQFNSATYCNFCGKKIWMKSAFQCSACNMISHKKCIEKCRAETLCSFDGPRRRCAPGEFWRTPTTARKQQEEDSSSQSPRQPTRSSRLLSKLKGSNKAETPKSDTSPQSSRRSQSQDKAKSRKISRSAMPKDLELLHGTLDDAAMNSAKQLGRQLFSQLEVSERKARLDHMVIKMQKEIDQESSNKAALTQQLKEAESHSARSAVRLSLTKSNEKTEALMLLLLQYCAGLQHCVDQEEEQRQQALASTSAPAPTFMPTASTEERRLSDPSPSRLSDVCQSQAEVEAAAAEAEERQAEEVVAQALTQLIHKAEHADDEVEEDEESTSGSEGDGIGLEDEEDEDLVEQFRPVYQTSVVTVGAASLPSPEALLKKAKATLEGRSDVCLDDEGNMLEESTTL